MTSNIIRLRYKKLSPPVSVVRLPQSTSSSPVRISVVDGTGARLSIVFGQEKRLTTSSTVKLHFRKYAFFLLLLQIN